MASVAASEQIRSAYGVFWKKPKHGETRPPIPPVLANVSLTISHTFATRMRVRLMKQMAKLHQAANPEFSVFVTNFLPRPTLKIRHPGGRVDSYTFVESIKRLGHHLSKEFLIGEADYAKSNISPENLVPYFLVLSPDLIQPPQPPTPVPSVSTRSQASKRAADQLVTPTTKKAKNRGRKNKGKSTPTGQTETTTTSNAFAVLSSPDATTAAAANRSFSANVASNDVSANLDSSGANE